MHRQTQRIVANQCRCQSLDSFLTLSQSPLGHRNPPVRGQIRLVERDRCPPLRNSSFQVSGETQGLRQEPTEHRVERLERDGLLAKPDSEVALPPQTLPECEVAVPLGVHRSQGYRTMLRGLGARPVPLEQPRQTKGAMSLRKLWIDLECSTSEILGSRQDFAGWRVALDGAGRVIHRQSHKGKCERRVGASRLFEQRRPAPQVGRHHGIWIAITVLIDVFRRHDIGGFSKAGWVILVIVVPFLGVLIYLLANHEGMAKRNAKQAEAQKAQFDEYVRDTAGGSAGEIAKAKELLESGAISQDEFDQIKRKALA